MSAEKPADRGAESAPSVLTLVRGRADRLRNLMRGLARQTLPPCELIIAWMQPEPAPDLPDPGCPVRHLHVPGEPMPLAAARNRAAEAARASQPPPSRARTGAGSIRSPSFCVPCAR